MCTASMYHPLTSATAIYINFFGTLAIQLLPCSTEHATSDCVYIIMCYLFLKNQQESKRVIISSIMDQGFDQ